MDPLRNSSTSAKTSVSDLAAAATGVACPFLTGLCDFLIYIISNFIIVLVMTNAYKALINFDIIILNTPKYNLPPNFKILTKNI